MLVKCPRPLEPGGDPDVREHTAPDQPDRPPAAEHVNGHLRGGSYRLSMSVCAARFVWMWNCMSVYVHVNI